MRSHQTLTLYQLHLPSEVRIFHHAFEPTHAGNDAVVMDTVVLQGDTATYCRGYYFLDRWLSVFVTFDEQLELKADPGYGFPFAFNCDITTPHYYRGDSIFTTDLYVDILVGTDGNIYQVEDLAGLQEAFDAGLFGKAWFESTRREADWLVKLLERDRFLDFLNEVEPFPRTRPVNIDSPMRRCLIDDMDFEYHPQYPRYEIN
jgi:hypothetical protein